MTTTLFIIVTALIILSLLLILLLRPGKNREIQALSERIIELQVSVSNIEKTLKEDFRLNRDENSRLAKDNRSELMQTLTAVFEGFQKTFETNVRAFNELQREKFGKMEAAQASLVKTIEDKLENIRVMVDEKLQKTLNERLGQSFELVGKQLESVQKGLGEMQNLAQDVGGLKKVLGNVKLRGGIGEVQLGALLEQILAPEQYEMNVKTRQRSKEVVEYAIKMPGRDEARSFVWLPIDAKFPKDKYEQLLDAYDAGDMQQMEEARKNLDDTVRKMAKDIHEKYLNPPDTTDFGIMFLPFEGIYAEVVRKSSLIEEIQSTYKVIVTGPSTLAALLNALQMGFRTLAIQKQSSEVWRVLGAVKKEFEKFGGMLEKAQGNIQTGLNQLDDVVGVRTRQIQSKLKTVVSLSEAESKMILPEQSDIEDDEGEYEKGTDNNL
jgi:DNA recombination protein RmuC